MHLNRLKGNGFTLIELMITVAIIGLLAAIALPSYTSQIAKGRRAECRSGLFQSMQQQERYYSQYNAYAPFTIGLTTAKSKAFSGDSSAASSCLLSGEDCTTAGSTTPNQCIELRANPVRADSSIEYLYIDSDGNKGCKVSLLRTMTDKTCWP
jgi:type IV pilus assembly protein PilE